MPSILRRAPPACFLTAVAQFYQSVAYHGKPLFHIQRQDSVKANRYVLLRMTTYHCASLPYVPDLPAVLTLSPARLAHHKGWRHDKLVSD